MKQLFFGDCLDILKDLYRKHPDGFIDLIYIDPPFNSKRNYNILFEDIDMTDTKAQREAFADTWSNVSYKDTLNELYDLSKDTYNFLKNLDSLNISKSAVAYLTTMATRIFYIRKVLKDTGSFYLHCDTNMSHYLKLVCDLIFGKENFRNEITWKRRYGFSSAVHESNRFGICTDIILFYSKSEKAKFIPQYNPDSKEYKEYVEKYFQLVDEKGRKYQATSLTNPGYRPNLIYEYKGFKPPKNGWMITKEKMEQWDKEGRIHFPKKKDGRLRRKSFADELKGMPIQNLWDDIDFIGAHSKEGLGYPTQKPEALLERIIKASSNEGDLVADFFCGCGTTIAVAQKLNRHWLGVDISHLAIRLILKRLTDPHEDKMKKKIRSEIEIHGFPKDIASAKELARKDIKGRFEFQEWVIEVLFNGIHNPKKVGDGGWDGYITFQKNGNEKGIILIEVKSGGVGVKNIREFKDVVSSGKADIGVFVCFADELTKPMLEAAKDAGKYKGYLFDRIQIITIEDLLAGKDIILPGGVDNSTFKKATKDVRPENNNAQEMF